MGSPVPQAPTSFNLSGVRTGEPVSSAGVARLADEVAHVTGHLLHKTGEAHLPLRPTGRTALEGLAMTVWVPWTRSPGAQVVRVSVEVHDSEEIGDSQTITTALPSGGAWLDAAGLDGTRTIYNPPRGYTSVREIVGWCDVSACTVGTLTDAFKFVTVPTTKGAGIRRATVTEVPVGTLAVSSTEPGFDAASARAGRPVIDGGSSSPRGMQRVWHCLDQGRAGYRQHLTLSGLESGDTTGATTTPHWSREASSYGAIDWLLPSSATDPDWWLVVRDLYSGTGGAFKFRVRYRTSNGTTCGIKFHHQGGAITSGAWVGAAAETTTVLSLPGTTNVWTWATAVTATIPVDGTDGLVRVRFEALGPGAGQLLSIACIDVREDES